MVSNILNFGHLFAPVFPYSYIAPFSAFLFLFHFYVHFLLCSFFTTLSSLVYSSLSLLVCFSCSLHSAFVSLSLRFLPLHLFFVYSFLHLLVPLFFYPTVFSSTLVSFCGVSCFFLVISSVLCFLLSGHFCSFSSFTPQVLILLVPSPAFLNPFFVLFPLCVCVFLFLSSLSFSTFYLPVCPSQCYTPPDSM